MGFRRGHPMRQGHVCRAWVVGSAAQTSQAPQHLCLHARSECNELTSGAMQATQTPCPRACAARARQAGRCQAGRCKGAPADHTGPQRCTWHTMAGQHQKMQASSYWVLGKHKRSVAAACIKPWAVIVLR